MAPSTASLLTIQPWAQETTNNNDIRDVLARAQRGHLRDITESSLQEEMAAEGALDLSDDTGSEREVEDEDADTTPAKKAPVFGKPSSREDLYNAKRYMLEAINAARQEVSVSLDLMSLIVSKDLPRQAQATMGNIVKEKVPAGTIGVDFWQRMPSDQSREAQDALLAANVKMDSLQSSADGLLGAAKRMEENVRRETQYWDQILSISSRGWNVCRVPGQQHKLGVRFGFSESAPQFSRKGIAALNPDHDGGIRLERGIGSKPRALRAVLRKDGQVVGASRLPALQDAEETTLEARIRHARDSLYDEELYHEIIRESRTLTSLGVSVEGSTVHLRNSLPDAGGAEKWEVAFDLISLDEDNTLPYASNSNGPLAQATILAARLLLSHAHRKRLHKRSEPPPPLTDKQKDERPVLPILGPLMALLLHHSALTKLNEYFATASRVLDAANISTTLQQPALPTPHAHQNDEPVSTTTDRLLATTLLHPLTSSGSLILTDDETTSLLSEDTRTFTVGITTTATSTPIYSFTIPTKRNYNFPNYPSFASAGSSVIASALASALLPLVQNEAEEWKVRDDEAVVEQDVGIGEMESSFAVEFDGLEGTLSVVFTGKERRILSWSATSPAAEGEEKQQGFFEACKACLT